MFSLRSLLLATAVAAVFVVAFLNSSPIWTSLIFTLTILLLIAALASSYLVREKRPFLVCAMIAGVIYGSVALIGPLGLSRSLLISRFFFGLWLSQHDEVVAMVPPKEREVVYRLLIEDSDSVGQYLTADQSREFRSFLQIGHCAAALILAVIAGLVGSYVARRRDFDARPNHVQS